MAAVVVFCCDSMARRRVDPIYVAEAEAARAAGLAIETISYEALVDGQDPGGAVRAVAPRESPVTAVYRGWMLTPDRYAALHDALADRGVRLINDAAAYQRCHWFPGSYAAIEAHTARSVWVPKAELSVERILDAMDDLPAGAAVIKDYVKSRKHEWAEACFLPDVRDRDRARRVVERFLQLQGDDLQGGVVVREFLSLESAGLHPRSGMPMAVEARAFVLDGRPILIAPYWDEATYQTSGPSLEWVARIATRIESRFFTLDAARRPDGEWVVIEIGDAQVSQLPERSDPSALYEPIACELTGSPRDASRPRHTRT